MVIILGSTGHALNEFVTFTRSHTIVRLYLLVERNSSRAFLLLCWSTIVFSVVNWQHVYGDKSASTRRE